MVNADEVDAIRQILARVISRSKPHSQNAWFATLLGSNTRLIVIYGGGNYD